MAIEMLTNAHNLLISIYAVWRRSSVGQSARFIPVLSLVRIQSPLPGKPRDPQDHDAVREKNVNARRRPAGRQGEPPPAPSDRPEEETHGEEEVRAH